MSDRIKFKNIFVLIRRVVEAGLRGNSTPSHIETKSRVPAIMIVWLTYTTKHVIFKQNSFSLSHKSFVVCASNLWLLPKKREKRKCWMELRKGNFTPLNGFHVAPNTEDFVGLIARAFHFNRWCLSIHSTIDTHTHKVCWPKMDMKREGRKNAKEKCNQLKRFSSHTNNTLLKFHFPFRNPFSCTASTTPAIRLGKELSSSRFKHKFLL